MVPVAGAIAYPFLLDAISSRGLARGRRAPARPDGSGSALLAGRDGRALAGSCLRLLDDQRRAFILPNCAPGGSPMSASARRPLISC